MLKVKIQDIIYKTKKKIIDARQNRALHKIQRVRDKEREKRRKGQRKFGQAKLKHSTMGMKSCGYAVECLGILLLGIVTAYLTRGKAGVFLGAVGIFAFGFAVRGVYAAFKGRRERDKNYITCRIGLAGNIILALGITSIFIGGFF